MTMASYNPDDPLFLSSRSLDGDLSDDERRALERAMDASPALRAEADRLAAADRLLREWGRSQPGVDWSAFGDSVDAYVFHEAEAAAVDRLVERWASSMPDIDTESFAENVLGRLDAKKQSVWARPVLRIGLPFAAAAAIGLAVMSDLWRPGAPVDRNPVIVVVDVGPSTLAEARDSHKNDRAVVSVSYSRERTIESSADASISFISISSAPAVRATEEYYPL